MQFARVLVSVTTSSANKMAISALLPQLVMLEIMWNGDLPARSYSLKFHLLTNDNIM